MMKAPLLFTALLSSSAHAIVNMESLHTGEPKPGFSGQVELSAKSSKGNSESQEYSLGTRLQHHHDTITNYLLLSGSYGESNGEKFRDKSFMHARHMRGLNHWLTAEAYGQLESDTFARLEQRSLLGGGARFTLLPRAEHGEIYLGAGAYYGVERIDDSYADGGTEKLWRANTYLVLKYQANDNTTLLSTTYYQPALKESSDYRLMEQAAMKVKVNEMLSLIVAVDYSRDSRPPIGVERDNVSYTTSLSLEF